MNVLNTSRYSTSKPINIMGVRLESIPGSDKSVDVNNHNHHQDRPYQAIEAV